MATKKDGDAQTSIDYSKVFPMAQVKSTIEEAEPDLLLQKNSAQKIGATSAKLLHELVCSAAAAPGKDGVIRVQDIRKVIEQDKRFLCLRESVLDDCQAHESTRKGGALFKPPRKRARKKETTVSQELIDLASSQNMAQAQSIETKEIVVDEDDYD